MTRARDPHTLTRRPPFRATQAIVKEWRRLKRENKWTIAELAAHLNLHKKTIEKIFTKDAYGELPK